MGKSDGEARLGEMREALKRGDVAAAGRLAQGAVEAGAEHPMALAVFAARREAEGDFAGALALLRRAKAAGPPMPGVMNGIGLYLTRAGRFGEAIAEYDEALAADPRFAKALANRGMALTALARLAEARRDFEAAAAIDPANLIAANGLAALALRRGEADEARRLARIVLAAAPGFPGAVLTLAEADIAAGEVAAAEATLRAMLARRIDGADAASARGLLGDALDAQKRYDEAYEAWSECNRLRARLHEGDYAGRPGTLALVRDLAGALEGRHFAAPASSEAGPARTHVFLLGFPRSGTTLVEQVLEEHPDIVTMAERESLAEASLDWLADPDRFEAFLAAPDEALDRYRAAYWRQVGLEGVDPAGKVFVDKHPFHSFRLPLIARLFPDARILFARRDPRDVVLSCFRHRFRMAEPVYQMLTLEGAADLYAATMALAEASEKAFDLAVHPAQLEAIIADFDGETKRICGFIGVDWREGLRDFAANVADRGVFTPSGPQLARGLNAQGVGRWHAYAGRIEAVMPALVPWVARFGAS